MVFSILASAGAIVLCLTTVAAIVPLAAVVPASNTAAGTPLFEFETKQLTDEVIGRLSPGDAKLINFDEGAVNSNITVQPAGFCKVFPGDADWPSQSTWERFNELLDGALIPTVPSAAPCYPNWGLYDKAKCLAIQANFSSPWYHEDDPTSVQSPLFQGRTCLPFDSPNGTCTLGGFPTHVVNVSTVAHVQLALNFARNNNLRLIVKNTGHDFLGRSVGAGSLSIWTHNLKQIDFIGNYQSDSGYKGKALKVGAGATVLEVYQAAHKNNAIALGGICESVGYAGGYVAGGGHTPMSGYYGMAADNVEALEVVTADGRFVTASNTSNPDLFWALRGGGGSTYGVVTSIVIRVHEPMPVVTSVIKFETSTNVSRELFWEGMRKYYELFIPFTDAHTYSFWWARARGGVNGTLHFEMIPFFAPNHTIDSFNELVKPWFDGLRQLKIPFTAQTTLHDSYYAAYRASWGNDTAGAVVTVPGNWLFPRGNWEDPVKFNRTFAAIREHSLSGRSIAGYHQAPYNRLNVDNAVSSAFRHTLSFLIGSALIEGAENATTKQVAAAADVLTNTIMARWRKVAPETEFGGSYGNEANVMQPNWQQIFYGTQYPKLFQLKQKWDPKSVFYGPTSVGSEAWEVQDGDQGTITQNGRLCRI